MFHRLATATRFGARPAATALAALAALLLLALLLAAAPPAAADAGKVHAGTVALFPTSPSQLAISLRALEDLGCPPGPDPPNDPPEECTIEVSEPDRAHRDPDEIISWAPLLVEVLDGSAGDDDGLAPLAVALRRVDLLSEPIALSCGDFRLRALLDPAAGEAVSQLALRFAKDEDAGWLAGPLRLPLRLVLLDGYRQPVAETTLEHTLHLFARWSGRSKAGYEKVGALAVDVDGDGRPDRNLPPPADLHPFLAPAPGDPGDPGSGGGPRAVTGCVPDERGCQICFKPPPDLAH